MDCCPEGIEGVAKGEAVAGRGRPPVRRSPSQLAQQRAERGVGVVAPRSVHDRFGRYRQGGGFGARWRAASPFGARRPCSAARVGGVLATAVTPVALDRFVPLMLEPFAEAEDLEQGDGHAPNGRQTPVAVVAGRLGCARVNR
ncbi:MAG: hypothetical protein R3F44_07490 [Candidatus Competibacteraceae bacterium]